MPKDTFEPKLGRIRSDGNRSAALYSKTVLKQAAREGRKPKWSRGHIKPGVPRFGLGTGARAFAGVFASGTRRVIVRARYSRIVASDLSAARAHLGYILRDGVTRDGEPGRLYDCLSDDVDRKSFLERSDRDPHQFRFILSPEDADRLPDLKPFVRDLMRHMEQDLTTKLDWVAIDHFNTSHPHTHLVIRGKDVQGRDLVIARDYIRHGVRARAQALITLELGRETEIERQRKLSNEVSQERLTSLDRSLLRRARDGIVVVPPSGAHNQHRETLIAARVRKLERLGLAAERRAGVWALNPELASTLRRLGERADKIKMVERALRDAGVERLPTDFALFERGTRKTPLIGKVVASGITDEISDRQYVVVDALDGRVHYAEVARVEPGRMPSIGMIVSLAGREAQGEELATLRTKILSFAPINELARYDGPTWLDFVILAKQRPVAHKKGFGAEFAHALNARISWLTEQQLLSVDHNQNLGPQAQLPARLRQREISRLGSELANELNTPFALPHRAQELSGIYLRDLTTPTRRLAVLRRPDSVTFVPWSKTINRYKGRHITGRLLRDRSP